MWFPKHAKVIENIAVDVMDEDRYPGLDEYREL